MLWREVRCVSSMMCWMLIGATNKWQHMRVQKNDDVIKWKHFPHYWPFVLGIQRSPVNSPQKGQRRGALMFSLIYVWINSWIKNREAGDLRHCRAHYDVIVVKWKPAISKLMVSHCLDLDETMGIVGFIFSIRGSVLTNNDRMNQRWFDKLDGPRVLNWRVCQIC